MEVSRELEIISLLRPLSILNTGRSDLQLSSFSSRQTPDASASPAFLPLGPRSYLETRCDGLLKTAAVDLEG